MMKTAQNRSASISRRGFVGSGLALGAAAVASQVSVGRAAVGANDRIRVGIVGLGVRGAHHVNWVAGHAKECNTSVAAVCDVWKPNLDRAAASVKDRFGEAPKTSTRYGDLLAMDDLDAVIVATPDFSHMKIALAALEAGKDVYIEKPMSLSVEEANRAVDLTREKQAVVQIGTQRRSDGILAAMRELVKTGVLGPISRVSMEYNFNEPRWARTYADCKKEDTDWDAFLLDLPPREFDPRLIRRWYLFKEFTNGISGLWLPHFSDATNAVLGSTYPRSAVTLGGTYVWKEDREHSDTYRTLLDFPEDFLMCWGFALGNEAGRYWTIHGTKGTLDALDGKLLREGGKDTAIEDRAIEPFANESHMANWLNCIRSRKTPNAPVETGHQHSITAIMAANALHTGQRQVYDRESRTVRAG